MSLEDLQYTEQYLTYIEGLLQQAVDSISTALAYAAQHANESQDSGGVHQALQLLETSMHNLVDLRAEAHGAVQAEIATEHDRQANAPADPDGLENPYE
jgi:hypothetical protein